MPTTLARLIFVFGILLAPYCAGAIELVVTTDNDRAAPASIVNYRIVVANPDGVTRSNVVVSATVPVGSTLAIAESLPTATCPSITGSASNCAPGEDPSWDLGDLAPGTFKVIEAIYRIDATAVDASMVDPAVQVDFDGAAAPTTTNRAVTVDAARTTALAIRADEQLVASDGRLEFEVAFGNIGPTGRLNVEIRADVPSGTTFVEASDGGMLDGSEVVWTLNVLDVGDGGKRHFVVVADGSGTDGNVLVAEARIFTGATLLTSALESVVIRDGVGLDLSVTVTRDAGGPSSVLNYRYVVSNPGLLSATDVALKLLPQNGASLSTVESMPQPTCSSVSGSAGNCAANEWTVFDLGTLPAGQSRIVEALVRVNSGVADGEVLVGRAQVGDGSGQFLLGTRPTVVVNSLQGLDLTMTADEQLVRSGGALSYELAYGNFGSTAETNVTLTASLPAQATFIEASDGGTLNADGDEVVWNLGLIEAGAGSKRSFSVTTSGTASDGEILPTHATINNTDPGALIRAEESVVVRDGVDLDLSITATRDAASPNSIVNYRYVVSNPGLLSVTNVSLQVLPQNNTALTRAESLPQPSCRSVTGSAGNCAANEWTTWELDTLAPGESRVIEALVRVNNGTSDGRVADGRAQVVEGSGAYTLGQRPTLVVNSALGLDLTMTASEQLIGPEAALRYELAFGNFGTTAETAAVLTAMLPAGATFVEASDGGTLNGDGDAVVWNLGLIEAGVGGKRSVLVTTPAGAADGRILESTAALSNADPGKIVSAQESVVIRADVNLDLSVTVTREAAAPSGVLNYRYVVSNPGLLSVTNVNLNVLPLNGTSLTRSEALPQPSCVSVSGSANSCTAVEWTNWDLGTLASGESRVIEVLMNALGTVADGAILDGRVQVTEGSGLFTLGTRPTVVTDSALGLDLTIAALKQLLAPGDALTYEIGFGNVGTQAETGLQLSASLPPGSTFVEASDGGVLNADGDAVEWDLDLVESGSGGRRSFTVTVAGAAADGQILETTAVISGAQPGAIVTAQESVVVRDDVDLVLSVTETNDPFHSTDFMYLRYLIGNAGAVSLTDIVLNVLPHDFTSVTLAEALPRPTCVSNSGTAGSCTSGEWATFQIGTLAPGEFKAITVLHRRSGSPPDGRTLVGRVRLSEGGGAFVQGTRPSALSVGGDQPDYRVTIEADSGHISGGAELGTVGYTVRVGNATPTAQGNALLTVELPPALSLVSSSGRSEPVDNRVIWPLGNIAANEWIEETFVAQLTSDGNVAGTAAIVTALVEGDDTSSSFARASVASPVVTDGNANTVVADLVSQSAPLTAGGLLDVSLTATNGATTSITDVSLSFLVGGDTTAPRPTDGTCVSTSGSAGTCGASEWISWDIGTLAGGAAALRTLTATVGTPPDGRLLLTHTLLTDSTNPDRDVLLLRSIATGSEHAVDANHDSEPDGIPDYWEVRFGLDRLDPADAAEDPDEDGLDNLGEFNANADPFNDDTDGDGILDGADGVPLMNALPVANAGADQSVIEGDVVTLDGADSVDPDNGSLTYLWSQTAGPEVMLSAADAVMPSFTAPLVEAATEFAFQLTVNDGANADVDAVLVTVNPMPEGTLDLDDNGTVSALSDGIIALRYMFGFRGASLTDGAILPDSSCQSADASATQQCVENRVAANLMVLDLDGDGTTRALSDGVLILRYLFGFTGSALADGGVSLDACTRCTGDAIRAYAATLIP